MVTNKYDKNAPSQSLATILAGIEQDFGKGTTRRLSDDDADARVDVISTGSLGVDLALGIGGLPRGRIVEVSGPEASGKTTLALHVIAEAQRAGGTCAFVDAEHALDLPYARRIGVRIDELLVSAPDDGEAAIEQVDRLVRSNAVDVIVIDSVSALVPRAELRGDVSEAHVGLQAQLMSKALRVLTGSVARSKTLVIFINQLRVRIGDVGASETTSGGRALKFYASVRLDVRRVGPVKEGERVIGNRARVSVVKNKLAAPGTEAEVDVIYGHGFARSDELFELGVELRVIEKFGSAFAFRGNPLGRDRDAAIDTLAERPPLAAEIAEAIKVESATRAADRMRRLARTVAVEPTPTPAPTVSAVIAA